MYQQKEVGYESMKHQTVRDTLMLRSTLTAALRMANMLLPCVALWVIFILGDAESLALDHSLVVSTLHPNSMAHSTRTHIYLPLIKYSWDGRAINTHNRQESLQFFNDEYRSSENTSFTWSGNYDTCNPGSINRPFQDAVLRRIKYFRAMAGVPANITLSDDFNRAAQAAAFMMSVNHQLSHTPSSAWICYSAAGVLGAGRSNLSLGNLGWDAITSQMKDSGAHNYFVGHRRWILYPQTQTMGIGNIPASPEFPATNALWVFDTHIWESRPPTREAFVAWPPPGYVPYQVVFPRWSLSYAGADFSHASVSMSSNRIPISLVVEDVVDGFGENTLVWRALELNGGDSRLRPAVDTHYTVTIRDIIIHGQKRSYAYDVVIFDPSQQSQLEGQSDTDLPDSEVQ